MWANWAASGGLKRLKTVFWVLLASGPLVLVISAFIYRDGGPLDGPVLALSIALSVIAVVEAVIFRRRQPLHSNEREFAQWYKQNFFLAFALVDGAYLITFVVASIQEHLMPILIGLPGYIIGMLLIGPTDANLRMVQHRVTSTETAMDVRQALDRNLDPSADGTIGG
jgi:hypothetical protein